MAFYCINTCDILEYLMYVATQLILIVLLSMLSRISGIGLSLLQIRSQDYVVSCCVIKSVITLLSSLSDSTPSLGKEISC